MSTPHFISSPEPFFELVPTASPIAATTPTAALRMHHGMVDALKVKFEHAQANENTAAVHAMTTKEFMEQQERQSINWLKTYAAQLNEQKALSAKFVFGRAAPIENAADRPDTALAILKNSS